MILSAAVRKAVKYVSKFPLMLIKISDDSVI